MADWLDQVVQPRVRPRTYLSYRDLATRHIVPGLGAYPLDDLRAHHVQAWLTGKLDTGLSARTVQYLRAILRSAMQHAYRLNMVVENVVDRVESPRSARQRRPLLNLEQMRAFLVACEQDATWGALFGLALLTGMRQGELLALRWQDIDWERGLLRVLYTLREDTRELVEPKTSSSVRAIPLAQCALALLGPRRQSEGLIFQTRTGTPLDADNVRKAFQRFLVRSQLSRIRFHDLRHCHATLLIAQGADVGRVSDQLGHASTAITLRVYREQFLLADRQTADALDQVFAP